MNPLTPPSNSDDSRQLFLLRAGIFLRALELFLPLCGARRFQPPAVFICHTHGDPYGQWIAQDFVPLLERAGIRVIFDWLCSGPGTHLPAFIRQILTTEWVLVMGSPHLFEKSLPGAKSTVSREVELLRERMQDPTKNDSVIPVVMAGEVETSLPPFLAQQVFVDLRDPSRFHAELFDLIAGLYGLFGDPRVRLLRQAVRNGHFQMD